MLIFWSIYLALEQYSEIFSLAKIKQEQLGIQVYLTLQNLKQDLS